MTDDQAKTLKADLQVIVNAHSLETESNTPDYVLADYLVSCLKTWNAACAARQYFSRKIPATSIVYGDATRELDMAMFASEDLPANCTRNLASDLSCLVARGGSDV